MTMPDSQRIVKVDAERRLVEVRLRMITDYYTGTSPDSPHWWTCRVCGWIWRDREPELHEQACPLNLALQAPVDAQDKLKTDTLIHLNKMAKAMRAQDLDVDADTVIALTDEALKPTNAVDVPEGADK